jgi:hypothetical protein
VPQLVLFPLFSSSLQPYSRLLSLFPPPPSSPLLFSCFFSFPPPFPATRSPLNPKEVNSHVHMYTTLPQWCNMYFPIVFVCGFGDSCERLCTWFTKGPLRTCPMGGPYTWHKSLPARHPKVNPLRRDGPLPAPCAFGHTPSSRSSAESLRQRGRVAVSKRKKKKRRQNSRPNAGRGHVSQSTGARRGFPPAAARHQPTWDICMINVITCMTSPESCISKAASTPHTTPP